MENDLFPAYIEYQGDGLKKTPRQLNADNTAKLKVDHLKSRLSVALQSNLSLLADPKLKKAGTINVRGIQRAQTLDEDIQQHDQKTPRSRSMAHKRPVVSSMVIDEDDGENEKDEELVFSSVLAGLKRENSPKVPSLNIE